MNNSSLLAALPGFDQLPSNDIENLTKQCTLFSYAKGEAVFRAGDFAEEVFIMVSGSAKLVRHHAAGKDRIVHIVMKGDLFGAAVALKREVYPISAVALEEVSVLSIQSSIFQNSFLLHPLVGRMLLQQMGDRIQRVHEDMLAVYDNVENRILYFLLELQERIDERFGKSSKISIPLTNQNIADRVGTTVETAIRLTQKLRSEGVISQSNRHYTVCDPESVRVMLKNVG